VSDDQRQRWRRGERPLVEDYLARYPALHGDPAAVRALIFDEFLLRKEAGEGPVLEEHLQRFPQHAEALRQLFQLRRKLQDDFEPAAQAEWPAARLFA
jgi:hypothetical protein